MSTNWLTCGLIHVIIGTIATIEPTSQDNIKHVWLSLNYPRSGMIRGKCSLPWITYDYWQLSVASQDGWVIWGSIPILQQVDAGLDSLWPQTVCVLGSCYSSGLPLCYSLALPVCSLTHLTRQEGADTPTKNLKKLGAKFVSSGSSWSHAERRTVGSGHTEGKASHRRLALGD